MQQEIITESNIEQEQPAPFVEVVVAVEEITDMVYLSDENSLPSSYSESYTTENEIINEANINENINENINTDLPKKKRTYKPRKKKADM